MTASRWADIGAALVGIGMAAALFFSYLWMAGGGLWSER
jgi:hypothetical protein